jgi:hypothetical protein
VAKCDQAVDPKCVKGVALSTVITSVRDASKTKAFNWPVADAVLTPVSGGRRLNAQVCMRHLMEENCAQNCRHLRHPA